jgi:hypothetical protein
MYQPSQTQGQRQEGMGGVRSPSILRKLYVDTKIYHVLLTLFFFIF